MDRAVKTAFFLLFCHLAGTAYAHPHIWITASAAFVWKENTLKGVYIDWVFDPYFGADILRGYDRNGDGAFDAEETRSVFEDAFSSLKEYGYFVFIGQKGKRASPDRISDFSVRKEGATVGYRFFVDLTTCGDDIYLSIYDVTYFCAIEYASEAPVRCMYDKTKVSVEVSIRENREHPVYYDPFGPPGDASRHETWKEGLSTFYPKEIHIRYAAIQK